MPFDQDRYRSLIARASFDCSFYKGTIQDQSKNALAMSFGGTPTWTMVNGMPALSGCINGVGAQTGNVAAILDVTGDIAFELCTSNTIMGNPAFLRQTNNGGFVFSAAFSTTSYAGVALYDAAGAVAKTLYLNWPASSAMRTLSRFHMVATSISGGTSCLCWLNGVPVGATTAGAGVVANIGAASPVRVAGAGGGSTGNTTNTLIRAYPFALTHSDAQALYGAAHAMFPEV